MRVPVYERREEIAPLQAPQVSPLAPAGDYGATAASVVKSIADRAIQLQNDAEDARTLELFSKFQNDSLAYHEDPDKGIYNTRLGYMAQNVYSDADKWLREQGEKYVKELKSNRAKKNFRDMARRYITQRGEQNSRFEASQMKKYREGQADAAYQNGLEDIAKNPYDDEAVNVAREQMMNALELKLRYSSPEEQKNALAKFDDDVAMTRFTAMLQDDPQRADKWYQKNKQSFSAQSRQQAENALETYRVQSIVDELITKFPQEREQEGLAWIREHYSGAKEEKIASAFKTRISEQTIRSDIEDRALRKQQNDNEDQILRRFISDGVMPSTEQLRQYVVSKQLRPEQFDRIENKRDNSARRSIFMRRERNRNPNASQQDLDVAFMRRMGTTNEEHRSIFAACVNAILTGQADEKILNEYLDRGKITTDEANRIKKTVKALTGVQKEFFNKEKSLLNTTARQLVKDFGFTEEAHTKIMENFVTRAGMELDNPLDKNYRENLQWIATEVLLEAIDGSGERTKGYLWGNTDLGDFREGINSRIFQPNLDIPELLPDDIDLQVSTGPVAIQMVQGGTITGHFSDWRAYRNGQHNGIDVAAPAGTDITMRDYGTVLTVSRVNTSTPSKGGGNSVTLSGTYSNGDTIDVIISHMQNDSINVNVGDVVDAGTVIGKVGNTGMTTDRSKGGKVTAWYEGKSSGYHMDLKIKINGKYVDPETFIPPRPSGNKQNQDPELKPLGDIFTGIPIS